MLINNLFKKNKPADGDKNYWKSTIVEKNVSIRSNSTILSVKICNNIIIGAGVVVTKNIKFSGIYAGNPEKK
jgi:acetyltransferase-like isoleucine patch superfamily enzyme